LKKNFFSTKKTMDSQLDCLKSLFGDLSQDKIYEMCQEACLCDTLRLEEPVCTDPSIFERFCPAAWFTTIPPSPSTTTTTTTTTYESIFFGSTSAVL
jgi:hypothetical protein